MSAPNDGRHYLRVGRLTFGFDGKGLLTITTEEGEQTTYRDDAGAICIELQTVLSDVERQALVALLDRQLPQGASPCRECHGLRMKMNAGIEVPCERCNQTGVEP